MAAVVPVLGTHERWLVQEFSIGIPSVGKVLFSYTAQSEVFIYAVKLSFVRFEDQLSAQVDFTIDDVVCPQPTSLDPTFPIGNGMENMFPFHRLLKQKQTFKIVARAWAFYATKLTKTGIVHVYGATL